MLMHIRVTVPTETGNEAIRTGTLGRVIEGFAEAAHPQCMVFGAEEGQRTMYAVFDLQDASDLPRLFEPMFMELGAEVHYMPVMDGEQLKRGLSVAMEAVA
jgi:hypothetical protein